jgi:uncharacterized protein YggE
MPANDADSGSIVVGGTGRVAVEADVADLRLGVVLARPTVEEARAEAAATMGRILAAVAEAGVAGRDVRTTLLSVQPRYDYSDGKAPAITGYELANAVEVVVRDLSRLGDVIDGTLRAGATSMDGLVFRVADPAAAEREARVRAMTEARAHAEVLCEAAGLSLVGVASVVEGTPTSPPIPFAKAERMELTADASTPVEAGSLEVAVTVTVTYRAR